MTKIFCIISFELFLGTPGIPPPPTPQEKKTLTIIAHWYLREHKKNEGGYKLPSQPTTVFIITHVLFIITHVLFIIIVNQET